MMKIITTLMTLFLFCSPAFADGGEFFLATDAGSSARMVRYANVEGFSYHSNTVFENPAGLYRIYNGGISAFSTTFMEEVGYFNSSAAYRLPFGVLGIGFMRASVDGLYTTVENNGKYVKGDPFDYKNGLVKIAYSLSQSRSLHLGISGSYYYSEIDTAKGEGFNMDFGAIIDSGALDFSFTVKNLLSSMKVNYTDSTDDESNSSDGQTEDLPLQLVYGFKYTFSDFDILAQLKTVGEDRKFAKSIAVNFNPSLLSFIHLSAGMKKGAVVMFDDGNIVDNEITNVVMGVGLDLFGLSFDYAYEDSDHYEFKNKHFFSFGVSF